MSGLESAAQLWANGDRASAFEALCGVWAQTQDLALTELCEQISELLVGERRNALRELSPAEQHAALMTAANAGDRVAVHALLPWLTSVARPKARQQIAYLPAPDPTLLRSLVVWLRRRPELNQLAHYLAKHRNRWLDLLHLWLLRDSPHERDRYHGEIRTRMLGLLPAPPGRTLSAAEVDELDALRASVRAELPAERRQADALHLVVCEHPRDDTHRALLADFLLSRDEHDPRGEFINLQLCAAVEPLPERARARERELLDRHGFRWLGPLAYDCYSPWTRFARGFVVELHMRPHVWREQDRLGAPGHSIWATVEVLEGGSAVIVQHPVMRSLRVLGCGLDCAEALLRGPARSTIEALSVGMQAPSRRNPEARRLDDATVLSLARELFANLDAVPNLRRLRLRDGIAADPDAWQWIWQGPRARIESVRLRLSGPPTSVGPWCERLRRDGSPVELSLEVGNFCFTLLPVDDHQTVRVRTVEHWPLSAETLLQSLAHALGPSLSASGLRRVEIVDIRLNLEQLREALCQHGLDECAIELVASSSTHS